jgi:cytochrome c-type biogenesis protein CcmH/NrfG
LQFDPEVKAQEFVNKGKAERLVSEGLSNVRNRKVAEAITAFNEAQKLDAEVEITAGNWNTLCKFGSLNKKAADVMFACEKAIKLEPDNVRYLANRGLARALTGDYQGAVQDFQPLLKETEDKEDKKKLEG